MYKKLLLLLLLFILVTGYLYSNEVDSKEIIVEGENIIFKSKIINLESGIIKIFETMDLDFKFDDFPTGYRYYNKNIPLSFFTELSPKEITLVQLDIFHELESDSYSLIIGDLKIECNIGVIALFDYLSKNQVSYEIEDNISYQTIIIKEHRIKRIEIQNDHIFMIQFR